MQLRTVLLAAASLSATATAAWADQSGPGMEIGEIVVTGDPLGRSDREVISSVAVVRGQDLDHRRQSTLGETLTGLPGVNSALWSTALPTDRWCAVTGSPAHGDQVRERVGARLRAQDRLIVGNWTDGDLLAGEGFDTVLADYLIGAVEGFSPYFQPQLLARLRPLVKRRLYVVGLDPYVTGEAPTEAARAVRDIGRLRDAVLLLAGETPYREFPAEWVVSSLRASGYRVLSARRFGNRYRAAW